MNKKSSVFLKPIDGTAPLSITKTKTEKAA